jgi:hypothetical protein
MRQYLSLLVTFMATVRTPRQAPTPEDWERLAGRLRSHATARLQELSAVLDELGPA